MLRFDVGNRDLVETHGLVEPNTPQNTRQQQCAQRITDALCVRVILFRGFWEVSQILK